MAVRARWRNDVSAAGHKAVLARWLLTHLCDDKSAAGRMALLARWRNDKLAAGRMMALARWRDDRLAAERTTEPCHHQPSLARWGMTTSQWWGR